jgi:hypothetical protein
MHLLHDGFVGRGVHIILYANNSHHYCDFVDEGGFKCSTQCVCIGHNIIFKIVDILFRETSGCCLPYINLRQ